MNCLSHSFEGVSNCISGLPKNHLFWCLLSRLIWRQLMLVFIMSCLHHTVCMQDQAGSRSICVRLGTENIVQLMNAAGRSGRQCISVCLCAREEQGKQMLLLRHRNPRPLLTSIKAYRHIKESAESTHRQFQMPRHSDDMARHYSFTADHCSKSSSHTRFQLLLFQCK